MNSRLEDAIKSNREREVRKQQEEQQHKAAQQQAKEYQRVAAQKWLCTASNLIQMAVNNFGNDAARSGSVYLFRITGVVPSAPRELIPVTFDIHRSGQLDAVSRLTFTLLDDGQVHAEATPEVPNLPGPVDVLDVTPEWARKVANDVLIATLNRAP